MLSHDLGPKTTASASVAINRTTRQSIALTAVFAHKEFFASCSMALSFAPQGPATKDMLIDIA